MRVESTLRTENRIKELEVTEKLCTVELGNNYLVMVCCCEWPLTHKKTCDLHVKTIIIAVPSIIQLMSAHRLLINCFLLFLPPTVTTIVTVKANEWHNRPWQRSLLHWVLNCSSWKNGCLSFMQVQQHSAESKWGEKNVQWVQGKYCAEGDAGRTDVVVGLRIYLNERQGKKTDVMNWREGGGVHFGHWRVKRSTEGKRKQIGSLFLSEIQETVSTHAGLNIAAVMRPGIPLSPIQPDTCTFT